MVYAIVLSMAKVHYISFASYDFALNVTCLVHQLGRFMKISDARPASMRWKVERSFVRSTDFLLDVFELINFLVIAKHQKCMASAHKNRCK